MISRSIGAVADRHETGVEIGGGAGADCAGVKGEPGAQVDIQITGDQRGAADDQTTGHRHGGIRAGVDNRECSAGQRQRPGVHGKVAKRAPAAERQSAGAAGGQGSVAAESAGEVGITGQTETELEGLVATNIEITRAGDSGQGGIGLEIHPAINGESAVGIEGSRIRPIECTATGDRQVGTGEGPVNLESAAVDERVARIGVGSS